MLLNSSTAILQQQWLHLSSRCWPVTHGQVRQRVKRGESKREQCGGGAAWGINGYYNLFSKDQSTHKHKPARQHSEQIIQHHMQRERSIYVIYSTHQHVDRCSIGLSTIELHCDHMHENQQSMVYMRGYVSYDFCGWLWPSQAPRGTAELILVLCDFLLPQQQLA